MGRVLATGMSGTGKSMELGRARNDYGSGPGERDRIPSDLEAVEPLLRATSTHEIDASRPLDEVVDALVAIGRDLAS